jgi:hypothetical protein
MRACAYRDECPYIYKYLCLYCSLKKETWCSMIHTVITMKLADGPAGVRAPASTPSSFKIEAASVNRKKEKKYHEVRRPRRGAAERDPFQAQQLAQHHGGRRTTASSPRLNWFTRKEGVVASRTPKVYLFLLTGRLLDVCFASFLKAISSTF